MQAIGATVTGEGVRGTVEGPGDLVSALDEASLSRFHLRAVVAFVLPSELYPITMRTTGHGISAGIGKLGAFIGVFLFPLLQTSLGLRGTLLLTAAVSLLGLILTRVLPEPAGRSLDDISATSASAREQDKQAAPT
jgi:hypothetical protein